MDMQRLSRSRAGLLALCALAIGIGSVLTTACRPEDPRAEVLKQRSRWTVDLLSWVPSDDGQISFTARLAGPPNSTIDQLTFRVRLLDAANATLAEVWRTADLSEIARGGPKDMFFKVDPEGHSIEGLTISLVTNPTPDEERQIKELQRVPAAGG